MAYNIWRGDAQAVAQVSRLTVGGTAATGDFITATINRKDYTYTLVGGDTLATAAAALYALVAASTAAEFGEAQWTYTDGNAYFEGLSNSPGVPFTVTASAGGGTGTTTLTASTPTASTGPSDYDNAENWSLGTVPSGSYSTIIDGGAPLLYGGGSIAGASIEVRGSFAVDIGLPQRNALGYYEYRTRYVTLNSAVVKIGEGDGNGSGRLLVKAVASSTWTVFKTSQRLEDFLPACDIDMTGNPTLINVSGGDVGLCVFNEGTARTVATVGLSTEGARITAGRNVTVTAFDLDNGQVDQFGTTTAATMGKGTYNQWAGSLVTLTTYGGYVRLNQAGTVTTLTARGQGKDGAPPTIDCQGNNLARVFTNSECTGGAAFLDPNKTVTLTNPMVMDGASYAASDIGPRFSIQRS